MQVLIPRWCTGAVLLAALAGCVPKPTVVRPTRPVAEPQVQTHPHWRFAQDRPAADSDGYQPPTTLAVLLPMSGPLATAAASIRDGLLAGYYGELRRKPELRFYDTQGTPEGARRALAQALAEGAGQILGPLAREEVGAVFNAPLPVPLLALNRAASPPAYNAASYSLAPEDEGTVAAQYLLARHARRVVVLSNEEETALRSVAALRAELIRAGGAVVDTIIIGTTPTAANTANLRAALSGEEAADAVFIALRAHQARLLITQSQPRFGNRPRVATSQLLQGAGTPDEDRVLDGIVFPGEPWPAGQARPPLGTASMLATHLPTARGAATRLFAFGFDAWQLSVRLSQLAHTPEAYLQGATGDLRLDADGTVLRTPAWLTFRRGVVVVLDGSHLQP